MRYKIEVDFNGTYYYTVEAENEAEAKIKGQEKFEDEMEQAEDMNTIIYAEIVKE